ncbi:MAG: hypothetical protein ACOYB2_10680 [Limnohabitans sp.]
MTAEARCDDCNPTDEFAPQAAEPGSAYCADHRAARIVVVDAMVGELSYDEVEAIGLDGTGRDGDERFPYTFASLTPDDRRRLLGVWETEFAAAGGRGVALADRIDMVRDVTE